jgi:hypothetical protein
LKIDCFGRQSIAILLSESRRFPLRSKRTKREISRVFALLVG